MSISTQSKPMAARWYGRSIPISTRDSGSKFIDIDMGLIMATHLALVIETSCASPAHQTSIGPTTIAVAIR
jgi:hypothetical protein